MPRSALSQFSDARTSPREVPVREAPATASALLELLREGPCVLRGAIPDAELSPWRFDALGRIDEALLAPAAPVRDGRVVIDRRRGLRTAPLSLADFARRAVKGPTGAYVAADGRELPEALGARLPVYAPLHGAPWRVTKLWVGAAGTLSTLHRDLAHNLHTVVQGRKRFWLASPAHDADVYPCAPWDPIPNGARADPDAPDLARHPRFARVRPWSATLRDGEALLLPGRWWHHVRNEEPTVAVNTFFAWGAHAAVVAAANALKGSLGLNR